MEKKETEKKEEFDAAGETIGYISLDQAVMRARRLVTEDETTYRQRLGWDEIVWTELSSDQREDSHRVVLQFRRPARGLQEEQTGEEEFVFDLLGELEFRQVLAWPTERGALDVPAVAEPIGELAGRRRRFLASLLDILIVSTIAAPLFAVSSGAGSVLFLYYFSGCTGRARDGARASWL